MADNNWLLNDSAPVPLGQEFATAEAARAWGWFGLPAAGEGSAFDAAAAAWTQTPWTPAELAFNAAQAGGTDGTANGVTVTAAGSLIAGTAAGAAGAAGVVLSAVASLTTGAATGAAQASGITLSAVASLLPGAAGAGAGAAGALLTVGTALLAGQAGAGASAAGAVIPAAVSLLAGAPAGSAEAGGALLLVGAELLPGNAAGETAQPADSSHGGGDLSTPQRQPWPARYLPMAQRSRPAVRIEELQAIAAEIAKPQTVAAVHALTARYAQIFLAQLRERQALDRAQLAHRRAVQAQTEVQQMERQEAARIDAALVLLNDDDEVAINVACLVAVRR